MILTYQYFSTFNFFKLLLIVLITFSPAAHCWTVQADFESGTVGSRANGADGFTEAFTNTFITNAIPAASGNNAAITSIAAGEEGFGKWGGAITFPDTYEGQELWFRVYIYYPNGFDFSTPGGIGLKTLRIHTSSDTGSNEGYWDLLHNGANGVTASSEISSVEFFANNNREQWQKIGFPITTGSYHAYEQYLKLSSISGQGIYRAWQNGKLVFEDTQTKTLRGPNSVADFVYIWTYWNGFAPINQSAYIDDIIITNERPSNTDTFGNAFIGTKNPKPPHSLIIE